MVPEYLERLLANSEVRSRYQPNRVPPVCHFHLSHSAYIYYTVVDLALKKILLIFAGRKASS